MNLIVSDSTTIITLINIDRVDILKNLFEQVIIPFKVYDEVCIKGVTLDASFFIKKEIVDKNLYKLLSKSLDAEESEALVLAMEMKLTLLIDEKKDRSIAHNMDIPIMGLLGVLLLGYKKSILSYGETLKVFESIKKVDFRVSQRLEEQFFELLRKVVIKPKNIVSKV